MRYSPDNDADPVQLQDVRRRYGTVQALDGVSLSVQRGELFGLIGHNGAGKSTLFKMMLGLIQPSGGMLRVLGTDTRSAAFRHARTRIGYLPENFVTYENLSGLEVLYLFADLKKVPRKSCGALLERVGLGTAASRRVHGYSKGMRQRLGLAQALLGEPRLLFLDEPTSGLDPAGIADFYDILHQLREGGATIVITSHILAEIQERVDRVVILQNGRIAAQGTLAQLRAQRVMPSLLELTVAAARQAPLRAALAGMDGLDIAVDGDCVRIACAPAQKVALLAALFAEQDAVQQITIHEPSLEDLFLGYGGRHAQAR